jgi:hypothetical protein
MLTFCESNETACGPRVLHAYGIAYKVTDVSEDNWRILQLRHATAICYKEAFWAEDNQFLK